MHKKSFYTAPKAELLVVQSEGFICTSGNFTIGGFEDDGNPLNLNSLLGLPGDGMGLTL